jgi:prepilin-type N-terminal cleavage/methylation domain-containing protein
MKRIHKGQRGLTIVELLIALPIAALIVAAATGAIIQLLNGSEASNRMFACRQVQTAGYWMSKDGVQAQLVDITAPPDILILEWETDASYRIIYSLPDMPSGSLKQLERTEEVNGAEGTTLVIATNLVPEETSCHWTSDEEQSFIFKVTARVGDQTETRIYEIKPRPLS